MQKNNPRKVKRYRIPSKERENFTRNLMLLLRASVPIGEALESLEQTTSYKPMKKALEQMQDDIDSGLSLSDTLERSGVASHQTLALVSIGEKSGRLVASMKVAAEQEEKQRIFRAKVRSALLYPTFVLSITIIVGIGVAWFLLPKLAVTFTQLNVQLPLISKILIGFGEFLRTNGLWAVPLAGMIVAVIIYILFFAAKTRSIGQRLLLHIPGIGGLIKDLEVARFGYLLGVLLDAGLSVTQAWELLDNATTSPRYQKLYRYMRQQFEDGYNFRESFKTYKAHALIPITVQQMVIAGERSGLLSDTLQEIGTMYEERADIATQNLESTLEPILLVIISAAVLAVAVAVILPIYSLLGGLS